MKLLFLTKEKIITFFNSPRNLKWGKICSSRLPKPVLDSVDTHLTDHCNLNCKGCSHFSSIANPWFADVSEFEKDMKRLGELFSNIKTIRLLGGEPLLHPEVEIFFGLTHRYFPASSIELWTNGVLLSQMNESFWSSCREYNILIVWTVYTPYVKKVDRVLELGKSKGVHVDPHIIEVFCSFMNFQGNSNPETAFFHCRSHEFCPFLKEGKIYICSFPACVKYFNRKFGKEIPSTGFMDLYNQNLTGWDVLISLYHCADICRFCSYDYKKFGWATSKKEMGEWDANAID
jgi:organic radical activating enzyme